MNQRTLIFLGPQGSGKGTQVKLLKDRIVAQDTQTPIVHFEMGKTLRDIASKENYTSKLMQEVIHRGELVPFNISCSVFTNFLFDHMQGNEHLLIDGFPRSETQMEVVKTTMEFYKREAPIVIHINISDEVGIERLLKRGRQDDTEETIRRRLAWSREEWEKILVRLKSNSAYTVLEINGDQSVEEVHKEILSGLNFA